MGLDCGWNRYYSSTWGRFTSADPYVMSGGLGNPQGWNRYAYVENSPLNYVDSRGLYKACPKGDGCRGDQNPPEDTIPPPSTDDLQTENDRLDDGSSMYDAGGFEINNPGIGNALKGLAAIGGGGFAKKKPCMEFLALLMGGSDAKSEAAKLAQSIEQYAAEASSMGYVYDGPSSNTPLDPEKFSGAATGTILTVSDLFAAVPGLMALSQYNGSAVWIRADDWSGFMSPFGGSTPNSYGLGTLFHEFLHKATSAGGFSHDQIKTALRAGGRNPVDFSGQNGMSRELGALCF